LKNEIKKGDHIGILRQNKQYIRKSKNNRRYGKYNIKKKKYLI